MLSSKLAGSRSSLLSRNICRMPVAHRSLVVRAQTPSDQQKVRFLEAGILAVGIASATYRVFVSVTTLHIVIGIVFVYVYSSRNRWPETSRPPRGACRLLSV